MPPSLIRSVREADLEEVRAIYAKEVLEGIASFEIEPPHIEEMRARLHRVQDTKLPYLVSELDGRIAGFAYAVPYRPRPAYRLFGREFGLCGALGAAPRSRHSTAGRTGERAGARQMVVIIGGIEHTASIRAHGNAGFRQVGTLENVGWKHGRWLDTVIMQRVLNPDADDPPLS